MPQPGYSRYGTQGNVPSSGKAHEESGTSNATIAAQAISRDSAPPREGMGRSTAPRNGRSAYALSLPLSPLVLQLLPELGQAQRYHTIVSTDNTASFTPHVVCQLEASQHRLLELFHARRVTGNDSV